MVLRGRSAVRPAGVLRTARAVENVGRALHRSPQRAAKPAAKAAMCGEWPLNRRAERPSVAIGAGWPGNGV